jgi:hypothetical protein
MVVLQKMFMIGIRFFLKKKQKHNNKHFFRFGHKTTAKRFITTNHQYNTSISNSFQQISYR